MDNIVLCFVVLYVEIYKLKVFILIIKIKVFMYILLCMDIYKIMKCIVYCIYKIEFFKYVENNILV